MRVAVDKLAARLGVPASEGAVRASLAQHAEDADHAAWMARHFPRIAASTPAAANEARRKMVEFDRRAREDPFIRPGSRRPVAAPTAADSATSSTRSLPGFGGAPASSKPGEVRVPGRPFFTRA